MAIHYGTILRERRILLGMTDTEVANASGLTIHAYDDVEQHSDEFVSNLALSHAQGICSVLGLSLRELLELPSEDSVQKDVASLIRDARLAKNLSLSELGDRIGFDEEVVRSLEQENHFEGSLPINVLFELEEVLGLARGTLIR